EVRHDALTARRPTEPAREESLPRLSGGPSEGICPETSGSSERRRPSIIHISKIEAREIPVNLAFPPLFTVHGCFPENGKGRLLDSSQGEPQPEVPRSLTTRLIPRKRP